MPLAEALSRCSWDPALGGYEDIRTAAKRIWQGYTPTIAPELLPALETLQRDVEILITQWAPAIIQWQAQRARWEGCDPEEDLTHDGLGEAACAAIRALEPQLATRQAAFSLFIIREFQIIELMASLPDDGTWMTDVRMQQRFTADRLVTTARLMLGVAEEVRRTLMETIRRLKDVVPSEGLPGALWHNSPCVSTLHRLVLHQQYGLALRYLLDGQAPELTHRERTRLIGQCLYQTQQYFAAVAVLEPQGLAIAHRHRIQQRLAQFAADMRAALPAYFVGQGMSGETVFPQMTTTEVNTNVTPGYTLNGANQGIHQPVGVLD
jgi:hypothetical protein